MSTGLSATPRLHINFGPGPAVDMRREGIGQRWCFICRKRREYEFVVKRYDCDPLDDYYGPWPAYQCSHCHKDGLLFPGHERIWGDE